MQFIKTDIKGNINTNTPTYFKEMEYGIPFVAQWLMNPTRNHEVAGSSLALLSGLRIWCCHELWCRLETWLRSHVAVAVV